ncbi:cyclic AMP-responsive element-binding protein 3-like protein 4 isoform X2 [Cynoglossus semilaevis]|uniref:cyclic AMP-responsive element-binding protein 3-like protein 4 isoform X2 n=1 Tax=Cynoglossus semilaevis TaxID=244447 RepID=UPI000497608C|nr:cyclic AMP-responsive element-binding protein 3-like protein 4 isoform X2 [Cynoglossus semilaevis]
MDAESGQLVFGGCVEADSWQLDSSFSCSEFVFSGQDKTLPDWAVDPDCDSDSEDVLHGVDPNEVFPSGPMPVSDPSSESDSGISEDRVPENPVAVVTEVMTPVSAQQTPSTVYQVVYDISGLRAVKAEPGQENVIAIELDEWSSQMLFSDSCVVNELPVVSANANTPTPAGHHYHHHSSLPVMDPLSPEDSLLYPELQLTEEEQKLLYQEGISLPNNLPLTKAEERILKKVRRKIRNKQSAQDSRRRRKEYVDGLENRAATCLAQNKELQRTVERLEKHNISLLAQLRQLQSLIKQTVSKGAQTSTCLLIILVSLSLIILPSFSPLRRDASSDDSDSRPIGVISRNILTDPASLQPVADEGETGLDTVSLSSSTLIQSEGVGAEADGGAVAAVHEETFKSPENVDGDISVQERNSSAPAHGVDRAAGKRQRDVAKPAHADEM